MTDGVFLPDGSFRHLLWVDGEALERLWRAEVLRQLVERGKIGQEVVESLLSWRHSGFSVHAGVRVEEKAAAARLLSLIHISEPTRRACRSRMPSYA